MSAFTVERYGDKAGVRAGEVPDPEVSADDVLVLIQAASINPLDRRIRDGEMKAILPYRVPFALGNDLAGVVVEVGTAVARETGRIRPVVDTVFPFKSAREALEYVEAGRVKAGKVVVKMT